MSDAERALVTLLHYAGVAKPELEYVFAPPRKWRFDLAWPAGKLAVEVEGGTWVQGRHTTGSGYAKDLEKYNTAALLGWTVLRFTPRMIEEGTAVELIEAAFARKEVA